MKDLTEDEMMIIHYRLNKLANIQDIELCIEWRMPGDKFYENISFDTDQRIAHFFSDEKFITLDFSYKSIKSKFDVDFIVSINHEKKIKLADSASYAYENRYTNYEEEISFCQLYLKAVESESLHKLLQASLPYKKSQNKAKLTRARTKLKI